MPEFEDQRGRREEKKQERERARAWEKGGRAAAAKRVSPRLRVDESGSHPLFRRAEPTPSPPPSPLPAPAVFRRPYDQS